MSLSSTPADRSPTLSPTMSSNHAHLPPSSSFTDSFHSPGLLQHRRGLSWHNSLQQDMTPDPHTALLQGHDHEGTKARHPLGTKHDGLDVEQKDAAIFPLQVEHTSERMITPFLTQHVPQQYNPQPLNSGNANTKYCYRHRPDLKCRRQADEPSMEELQSELGNLSQSDQQAIAHVWALFSAAPSKHRNLMLQGILAQCCFPQLSFISTSVRNLIKIDFLAALPPELGFKILCYLDTTSLCKASQVSRKWRTLADDDVVWHKMCEQHIDRKCTKCGWGLPLLDQKRLRTEKRQIQLRATGRGLNEWSPNITPVPEVQMDEVPESEPTSIFAGKKRAAGPERMSPEDSYFGLPMKRPWKDVYKDRFKVGTNWKYGRCTTKVFKGHSNGIMCLQFDDNILATGSYDCTVKIWDIDTGKEMRALKGHTGGIRCLQFDDTRLLTGSIDKTIRVWNWRTGECVKVLHGHTNGVVCLHWEDNILASGSMDHKIRIWNFQNGHKFTLLGHDDWVNHVKIDSASRTLFSASDDCTVRLWDLDARVCLKIFKGHVGQVQQVLLLPPEFEIDEQELRANTKSDAASSASDSNSATNDAQDPNITLFPDDPTRPAPPSYMLTGSLDGTIRLWHIPSGRCVHTFFGHIEGIWALAADTLRLVSGAEDKMVKVWDPRTGKHERTFYGHSAPVTCVGLSDSRLASGGEDCEVRVYSFTDEEGEAKGEVAADS